MNFFRFSLWTFSGLLLQRGTCYTCIKGVCMEGSIQIQKHGLTENFAPRNIGIMHISKIWVAIFMERQAGISSFQFNNVLYSQHLLAIDSKRFSFWKYFIFKSFFTVVHFTLDQTGVGETGARCNNFAFELHNFLSKENKPKQNITFGSPFSLLAKLAKKEF